MLSLTLKDGQLVRIGEVVIRVYAIERGQVSLAIEAPKSMRISRPDRIAAPRD